MAWGGNTKQRGEFFDYNTWLQKFDAPKTTDDCYTPPLVYDAVADWVAETYGLDRADFVRPFYPGGDYESFPYPDGCVVVDNPPFSMLAGILRFYQERGIPFYLFAPGLTTFSSSSSSSSCCLCVGYSITYENGAKKDTSFITSLEDCRFRSAPDLYQAVKEADEATQAEKKANLPKYTYPDSVCTAAMVNLYSKYGVPFRVERRDSERISALDSQRKAGKAIFGCGYLLSERAAAERAAAERAAAERAAAERAAAERAEVVVWELSDREREIISKLGE